jgi:hypothetical protein
MPSAPSLSNEIGMPYAPPAAGELVAGTFRKRLTLSSGRFAMIDNGLGFALVRGRRRSIGISAVMSPASPARAAGSIGPSDESAGWRSDRAR